MELRYWGGRDGGSGGGIVRRKDEINEGGREPPQFCFPVNLAKNCLSLEENLSFSLGVMLFFNFQAKFSAHHLHSRYNMEPLFLSYTD